MDAWLRDTILFDGTLYTSRSDIPQHGFCVGITATKLRDVISPAQVAEWYNITPITTCRWAYRVRNVISSGLAFFTDSAVSLPSLKSYFTDHGPSDRVAVSAYQEINGFAVGPSLINVGSEFLQIVTDGDFDVAVPTALTFNEKLAYMYTDSLFKKARFWRSTVEEQQRSIESLKESCIEKERLATRYQSVFLGMPSFISKALQS